MNAMFRFFDAATISGIIDRLGWLLVHSLWQFTLIAFAALLLSKALRRSSSNVQYWMLTIALALMVVSPLLTLSFLPQQVARIETAQPIHTVGATSPGKREFGPGPENVTLIGNAEPRPQAVDVTAVPLPPVVNETDNAAALFTRWSNSAANWIAPWLTTLVGLWCGGVLVFSLRPVLSWYQVRRLCRIGVSAPSAALTGVLAKLISRLRVRTAVRLLQSTLVEAPIVVGCFRCVILLPASLAGNLPLSQLEAIIAHELSHVRRYDYLVNLWQTIVETLFFYHPAVWWLSNRIRLERENCCDDLVVANSISKVDYGRALLAIEESRARAMTLALSARGGSLLGRVQRMLSEPARETPRAGIGMVACMLLAVMTSLALWSSVASGNADESKKDAESAFEFGDESNGLRVRVTPIAPGADVEHPDLKQTANSFKRSSDMTFAVEIKNVSDKPIEVAGVRYGDGYAPESQGQLRVDMYAPQWFDLMFTDSQDRVVPRSSRTLYEGWHMGDSASVHKLQPNESLIEVLKPSELMAPFNHDLTPGKYKLTVRYHGPDDDLKNKVRKHWPQKPILNAWSHDASSNAVEFAIEEPSDGARPEDLVWGDAVGGLQAAVEFKTARDIQGNPHVTPGILVGSNYHAVIHVRNASDKTITFISETGRQGDEVHVADAQGNKVEVAGAFYTGWPIDVLWTLKPGEEAQLPILTPSINSIDKSGKYSVRYTIRFNSRQMKDDVGNITFPRPGDYDQVLDTGEATLYLKDKLVSAVDTQSNEPFRLKDHWIVEDVLWINNDQELMTVSLQGGVNVRRWDVASRKLISEIKLQSDVHGRDVKQGSLKFSRNGKRIIGVTDVYVGVWDSETGQLLRQLPIPKKEWEYDTVRCLDCSADGSLVVAGLGTTFDRLTLSYDSHGILWNAETGETLRQFTLERGYYFDDVAMSSDGSTFVTCSERGGTPTIWESKTAKVLHDLSSTMDAWKSPNSELISNNMLRSVGISPDGRTVALSSTFGVRLFDSGSGKLLRTIDAPFRYHSFARSIEFSSDGKKLARFGATSGEKTYTIPVWSVDSAEKLFELESGASTGSFSADGKWLASAESDFYEAVSIWPLSGDPNKRFTAEPVEYERINRVEENTHMKGTFAKELADRWPPQWGQAEHGVQYGIAYTTPGNQFEIGQQVLMVAFVRNGGDKAIQFDMRPDMFGNLPQIVDANGKPAELSALKLLSATSHYRDTLEPGEVFGPLYLNLGLGESRHPNQETWTPFWKTPASGDYKLVHQIKINIADPQVKEAITEASWHKAELKSGTLELKVGESTVQASQNNTSSKTSIASDDAQTKLPWRAFGRVVDRDGKPLAGVKVHASTGVGTLRGGASGTTDADGRYDFRFGMGMMFGSVDGKPSPQTQYALVSAHLDGYFEANMSRQGNGIASMEAVAASEAKQWGVEADQVCLPDRPREINFVMLPAAKVSGTLVGTDDKPLKNYSVALTGHKLSPGASVLSYSVTDERGHFSIKDIPKANYYQFVVRKPNAELAPPWNDSWASGTIAFDDPGDKDFKTSIPVRTQEANASELKSWTVDNFVVKVLGPGVHEKTALKEAQLEVLGTSELTSGGPKIQAPSLTLILKNQSTPGPVKADHEDL